MKTLNNLSWAMAAVLVSGQTALAQDRVSVPNPTGATDFGTILSTIINGLLIFAGAIAVLFLIIGGFRYVVSTGNPEQVEGAKKTILYAILGLIVIFIAFLIVNVILVKVLGVDTGSEFVPQGTK